MGGYDFFSLRIHLATMFIPAIDGSWQVSISIQVSSRRKGCLKLVCILLGVGLRI
jgi:hypothetical protein